MSKLFGVGSVDTSRRADLDLGVVSELKPHASPPGRVAPCVFHVLVLSVVILIDDTNRPWCSAQLPPCRC